MESLVYVSATEVGMWEKNELETAFIEMYCNCYFSFL